MQRINARFIKKWSDKFDAGVPDESRYSGLLHKVQADICEKGSLTKPVFISIVNWKSPRVRPIFEKRDYRIYRNGVRRCLSAADDDKLSVLVELPGIGAPMGSTILHFIYPDSFPIMDVRVTEALYQLGYIGSKSRDEKRYPAFREAILNIKKYRGPCSLRQIDKALFAYHKLELSKGL